MLSFIFVETKWIDLIASSMLLRSVKNNNKKKPNQPIFCIPFDHSLLAVLRNILGIVFPLEILRIMIAFVILKNR